jgi:pimeloyl-ACP methyl ester carboxylesterase
VAQLVADRFGHQVRRIVFISAWVLCDGESILDVHTPAEAATLRATAARSLDHTIAMDIERWASSFMQDATPGQLAATTGRLVPTPLGWFDEPIKLARFFDLPLPASYVFLRDDRSAPKERYRAMAARLDQPLIVECNGSHQAMLTQPKAVANALRAAIEL